LSTETLDKLALPTPDVPIAEHQVSLDVDEALPEERVYIPILTLEFGLEITALRWQVRGLVVLPLEGSPVFRRVGLMEANFPSEEAVRRIVECFERISITVV
jgi:hypothetical protein